MGQLEFTWWAEDGSERRGHVSLAPDASPETMAALARMMHLTIPAEARAGGKAEAKAGCKVEAEWFDRAWQTLDGPLEEPYGEER